MIHNCIQKINIREIQVYTCQNYFRLISGIERYVSMWMIVHVQSVGLLTSQQGLLSYSVVNAEGFTTSVVSFLAVLSLVSISVIDNVFSVILSLFAALIGSELSILVTTLVVGLSVITECSLIAWVVEFISFIMSFVVEGFFWSRFILMVSCFESFLYMSVFVVFFLVISLSGSA